MHRDSSNNFLWFQSLVGALIVYLLACPWGWDPLVRHDDFPALLGLADLYYLKTLYEGRWINYLWHLRGWLAPSAVNLAIFVVGFGVYYAVLTRVSLGDACANRKARWALLGLLCVNVSVVELSQWANTLVPAAVMLGVYALIYLWLPARARWALLVVGGGLGVMSYTTLPFFMMALHLADARRARSWGDLMAVLTAGVGSVVVGLFAINALNYWAFGYFGVALDTWRQARPASDFSGLIENLWVLGPIAVGVAKSVGLHIVVVGAAVIMGGLWCAKALNRQQTMRGTYLIAGAVFGVAILAAHSVLNGYSGTNRAFGFVWSYLAILSVLAATQAGASKYIGQAVLVLGLAAVLSTAAVSFKALGWQWDTRAMARELATHDTRLIAVLGRFDALPSAVRAEIQGPDGLRLRLQYLTGRTAVDCAVDPKPMCRPDMRGIPLSGWAIRQNDSASLIILPN